MKQQTMIVVALATVLGVVVFTGPLKSMGIFRASAPASSASEQQVGLSSVANALQRPWQQMEAQLEASVPKRAEELYVPPTTPLYAAQTFRDPFKTLLPEEPAAQQVQENAQGQPTVPPPPQLTVLGIVWGGEKPKAIINHHVYGVGDVVEGDAITSIERTGVTINHHGTAIFYPSELMASEGEGLLMQPMPWR